MAKKILVEQIRSIITETPNQKANLRALGLRRIGSVREHEDNQITRGMISRVQHLVKVTEVK